MACMYVCCFYDFCFSLKHCCLVTFTIVNMLNKITELSSGVDLV